MLRSPCCASTARLLAGLLALLAAAGCGDPTRRDTAAPIVVTDDAGRQIRLDGPASRVVSLLPAATDLLIALGAADRLVARTDYDLDPALAHLPSVGGGLTPSIEWLAARRPELVIAWPDAQSRSIVGRLAELGIPVYAARVQNVMDIDRTTRALARLLGAASAGDSLADGMQAELEAVRRAVAPDTPRPRVLYLIGIDPPMAAGPDTFLGEVIEIAGGRNVLADAGALWPHVSLEEVVRRQPDVIVVGQAGAGDAVLARFGGMPGWRDVRAVRSGRVLRVDVDLFNRPGPRVAEAARRLAAYLHPRAFVEHTAP